MPLPHEERALELVHASREALLFVLQHHWLAWLIAFAWASRAAAAMRGLPTIPNLLLPQFDAVPEREPSIVVIVPARNEERDIAATLESLLAQDYPYVKIIAVNDRSTDTTGAAMDAVARQHPGKLTARHVEVLPEGWLGKTHAMALAADVAMADGRPDFLLFTAGDVLFASDALRRALVNAQRTRADHFVLFPTTIIRRWDEAALLGFFQIMGLWAVPPWRVAASKSWRDAIGIGAFNMMRTEAYQKIGGFAALRMEIVEDLALARRVKRAGLSQRVAFGRDMVGVHWAAGGPVNVMTKNIFSAFHFSVPLLLIGCVWLAVFCVGPFVAIFIPGYTAPAAVAIVSLAIVYALIKKHSGLSAWNALLAPFAAATFIYALLRSMVVTRRQGGVIWRGTCYPLAELRRNAAPLFPRR